MNQAQRLLERVRQSGVQLWTVGGRLRYQADGGLDAELATVLRRHKSEIIELLHAEQVTLGTPLVQVGRGTTLPLSSSQQGLWFLEELGHVGPGYNALLPVRIVGPLNIDVLRRAIQEIVRRHEILRTRFRAVDGVPTQVITDAPARFVINSTEDAGSVWARHATHRFDLSGEDLFRVEVLPEDDDRHLMIISAHHLIYDGTSSYVFFRELELIYEAFLRGLPSPLAEPSAQYADFAVWDRERADGDVDLAYWKERLAGAPGNLELPLDRPRPQIPDLRGMHCGFKIHQDMADRLTAFGVEHNATLAMVLFAGYYALLSRWTGQSDISVGMPIDCRVHPDTQQLIGHFLNTVVIRVGMDGAPTFADLLHATKAALLEAYEHRGLPFDRLVAELSPDRGGGWSQALFQTMFSHRIQEEPRLGDLKVSVLDLDGPTAKFELTLFVMETLDGVDCSFEYATALFDGETIERLADRYVAVLEAVLERPDTPLAELPMLSAGERVQLLDTWNATSADIDTDRCLHEAFETMADAHPERTAVVFEGRTLTYGELERRANQVAHRLRSHGIGPERPVAVRMNRSLELLPCLLGILKAGAPYVPIDSGYPVERQEFMLSDSGASVLLSETGLPAPAGVLELPPDADGWPIHRPSALAVPDNLAYIIYTSGSTGYPKGVGIGHRAIVNRIEAMQQEYGLDAQDTILQKTPITFDVSVWELFWSFTGGGKLVLAAPGGHRDPGHLADLIRREKVTTVHFVPSMLTAFLADGDAGTADCPSLRRVICSGEELSLPLARRFMELFDCDLFNRYGPTEAAVECSVWHCGQDDAGRVPIGRPTPNVRLYVLDELMRPVPIGVSGELHIGGVQVARGYQNRPDLTAARFVPDPYGPPGSRLYRTGDLARVRNDGAIEFLGRLDDQVKVRGHRIELGEIESVIRQCPGVRDAAVAVRDRATGDRHLAAYVVGTYEIEDVRRDLRRRVPDYMMPAAILPLAALPLTGSGKLDRKALPAPEFGGAEFVPPRNAREAVLTEIWAEVLGCTRVGVLDNFFDLGGHSLLATQVLAGMRRRTGVDIPLEEFYARPTISDLVALSREGRAAEDDWFVRLTPPGRFVLFVLPAAGMGPSTFRGWREDLPDGVEIVAINLPGREKRFGTAPMTHIDPLALQIAEAIEGRDNRPYAIFGHSAGALIGREVARRVGWKPALLAVAASHSPDRAAAAAIPPDEELLANLVRWGHVSPELLADPSHPAILLPPLRGDLEVAASCRKPLTPAELLDIPIVAFAGANDKTVTPDDCLNWRAWTSARFTIHLVDGDHFFPLVMGRRLAAIIAREAERH